MAFDWNNLAEHEIGFQDIEHHARRLALGRVEHQIALGSTFGTFSPYRFDVADFADGHTKLFGHTSQVVAAVTSYTFAVVLGYIQYLGLRGGCPSSQHGS